MRTFWKVLPREPRTSAGADRAARHASRLPWHDTLRSCLGAALHTLVALAATHGTAHVGVDVVGQLHEVGGHQPAPRGDSLVRGGMEDSRGFAFDRPPQMRR